MKKVKNRLVLILSIILAVINCLSPYTIFERSVYASEMESMNSNSEVKDNMLKQFRLNQLYGSTENINSKEASPSSLSWWPYGLDLTVRVNDNIIYESEENIFEVDVDRDMNQVQVRATASSILTLIKIGNNPLELYQSTKIVALTGETTVVPIVLMAPTGLTRYTELIINREIASDDTTIQSLKVENTEIPSSDGQAYITEINEDKNEADLSIVLGDINATVEIKKEIEEEMYQEIEIGQETQSYNIPLNELGVDTKIQIKVTAEDEETINIYELTIKRPCGIIRGSIHTINVDGLHIADIKIYGKNEIDWDSMLGDSLAREELETVQTVKTIQTYEDGTYEIKLVPGKYELLITKKGYLDHIVVNLNIQEETEINIEREELVPGDVNKDGVIALEDLTYVRAWYGSEKGIDEKYDDRADLGEKGYIGLEDATYVKAHYGKERKLIVYEQT